MSSTITSTVADAKASAAGRTRPATATVPTVGKPSAPPLPLFEIPQSCSAGSRGRRYTTLSRRLTKRSCGVCQPWVFLGRRLSSSLTRDRSAGV